MKVQDVMSENVSCAWRNMPLQEVARIMVDCDCGEVPVIDESYRPIGVVTDRDITCRVVARGRNPLDLTAGDCMTTPAVIVTPLATLDECCEVMEEGQIRRVPVVDDEGRCIGIVSQADIARYGPDHVTAEVVQRVSEPTAEASNTVH